jgi:uncharacterized membrane protein
MKNSLFDQQDRKIEMLLGTLLRIGVLISTFVVLTGAVIFLFKHGTETPHYFLFHGKAFRFSSFIQFLNELAAFHGLAIIQLGIFFLVAIPILRVLFSVITYLYEKDYVYVIFTMIVFLVLVYSFVA